MNETEYKSLSDTATTSDITASLGLSVDVFASDSTASSDVSLSSGVCGLSSGGVDWASGVLDSGALDEA